MQAIRICRKLESTTPHLPELKSLVGKKVEFIVREELAEDTRCAQPGPTWINPLRGSVIGDDDPFGPAVPAEEPEANR
jgi:hypothetical protein